MTPLIVYSILNFNTEHLLVHATADKITPVATVQQHGG